MNIEQIVSSLQPSKTGSTANKYIIPAGQFGNNTGSNVEIIIPNNYNVATSSVYGHFDGMGKNTWSGNESYYLNNNTNGGVIVKLNRGNVSKSSQSGMMSRGHANMQILDYVSGVTGINSASIAGASDGTMYALATAAASAEGNYSTKITSVASLDYGNPNKFDPTFYFEKMLNDGISFEVISGGVDKYNGGGKMLARYAQMGGDSKAWLWNGGLNHDYACRVGARQYLGIDAEHDIVRKVVYNHDTGELEFINITPVRNLYGSSKSVSNNSLFEFNEYKSNQQNTKIYGKSSDKVSTEYGFVVDTANSIGNINNSFYILNIGKISIPSSGSSLFKTVNTSFKDYVTAGKMMSEEVGTALDNIVKIADCMYELDASMSASVNSEQSKAVSFINSMDTVKYAKSYDISILDDISTMSDGDIKLTVSMLNEALSQTSLINSTLQMDIVQTRKLANEISSFVNNSGSNLIGSVWDTVRNKMSEYVEVCNAREKYAQEFIDKSNEAFTKLLNYMDDYDSLDTAELPSVIQNIIDLNSAIASLEAAIAAADEYTDVSALQAQIEILSSIRDECMRLRDKLQGLPEVDNQQATQFTNDTQGSKNDYNNHSYTGGGTGGYTPPVALTDTDVDKAADISSAGDITVKDAPELGSSTPSPIVNNGNSNSASYLGYSTKDESDEIDDFDDVVIDTSLDEEMDTDVDFNFNKEDEKLLINPLANETSENKTVNGTKEKSNGVLNMLGTVAGIAGVIGVAGAAAYGSKKVIDKKQENDSTTVDDEDLEDL